MQRSIKFRAWMSDIKEMTYDLAFEDYEPINDLLEGVEYLMQYTGLKDKNGVEIYEGDVVRIIVTSLRGGRQSYSLPIVWDDVHAMYIAYRVGVASLNLGGRFSDYEVIGNIWENPELLEAAS